jgi:hypothetical protein
LSFKRAKVLRAFAAQGARVLREGAKHTVIVSAAGKKTTLPRHADLDRISVRKIAQQLGLDLARFDEDVR